MSIVKRILGLRSTRREGVKQEEARAAIQSGEAARMPLREFESRFNIQTTTHKSRIYGYPKSPYYRAEDLKEKERNRELVDDFLTEDVDASVAPH